MDSSLEYLLEYLKDEFRGMRNVRIRLVQRAGQVRSPDLEQDYDATMKTLHKNQGVLVVTTRREYYFPTDWIEDRQYDQVQKLVSEIRDTLE